jgi:hypothetical protein
VLSLLFLALAVYLVVIIFKVKPVVYSWKYTPLCTTSTAGKQISQNAVCMGSNGKTAHESMCTATKPPDITTLCPLYTWQVGEMPTCTTENAGKTIEQPLLCKDATGQTVQNFYCENIGIPKPYVEKKKCPTYKWQVNETLCANTNVGQNTPNQITCVDSNGNTVDASFCDLNKKPVETTSNCPVYEWKVTSNIPVCTVDNQNQSFTEKIECVDANGKVVSNLRCPQNSKPVPQTIKCPTYVWTRTLDCNESTVNQEIMETVKCVSSDTQNQVPDSYCDARYKPTATKKKCSSLYKWKITDLPTCGIFDEGETVSQRAVCIDVLNNDKVVRDSNCDPNLKPPESQLQTKLCPTRTYEWVTSEPETCSISNAGETLTQRVYCVSVNPETNERLDVPDTLCDPAKKPTVNTITCPDYQWKNIPPQCPAGLTEPTQKTGTVQCVDVTTDTVFVDEPGVTYQQAFTASFSSNSNVMTVSNFILDNTSLSVGSPVTVDLTHSISTTFGYKVPVIGNIINVTTEPSPYLIFPGCYILTEKQAGITILAQVSPDLSKGELSGGIGRYLVSAKLQTIVGTTKVDKSVYTGNVSSFGNGTTGRNGTYIMTSRFAEIKIKESINESGTAIIKSSVNGSGKATFTSAPSSKCDLKLKPTPSVYVCPYYKWETTKPVCTSTTIGAKVFGGVSCVNQLTNQIEDDSKCTNLTKPTPTSVTCPNTYVSKWYVEPCSNDNLGQVRDYTCDPTDGTHNYTFSASYCSVNNVTKPPSEICYGTWTVDSTWKPDLKSFNSNNTLFSINASCLDLNRKPGLDYLCDPTKKYNTYKNELKIERKAKEVSSMNIVPPESGTTENVFYVVFSKKETEESPYTGDIGIEIDGVSYQIIKIYTSSSFNNTYVKSMSDIIKKQQLESKQTYEVAKLSLINKAYPDRYAAIVNAGQTDASYDIACEWYPRYAYTWMFNNNKSYAQPPGTGFFKFVLSIVKTQILMIDRTAYNGGYLFNRMPETVIVLREIRPFGVGQTRLESDGVFATDAEANSTTRTGYYKESSISIGLSSQIVSREREDKESYFSYTFRYRPTSPELTFDVNYVYVLEMYPNINFAM